jgi:hypothetical protein
MLHEVFRLIIFFLFYCYMDTPLGLGLHILITLRVEDMSELR